MTQTGLSGCFEGLTSLPDMMPQLVQLCCLQHESVSRELRNERPAVQTESKACIYIVETEQEGKDLDLW